MSDKNTFVQPFSAITESQIQDWKAKYCELNLIEINAGAQTLKFIAKKPNRATIELIAQHGINKDVAKTNNALIVNCVLGGDIDELESDGGVYLKLIEQLNTLKAQYTATTKKL